MKTNATVKDVAELAKVSVATVSRVLSGKPASEHSRKAVKAAAQTLNYTPNGVARSLRVKKQGVIAVLVSDVSNPYFGVLAHSLQLHLAQAGFSMIIGNASEDFEKQEEFLAQALERRVDGMIIVIQSQSSPTLERIQSQNIPVVFVDRTAPGYTIPAVDSDAFPGIHQALEHLKQLGHLKIGLIPGPEDTSTSRQRYLAFSEIGAELDLDTICLAEPGADQDSVELVKHMLSLETTALIFAYTPRMWPALSYLEKSGVKIPDDLSVIAYDDLPLMKYLNPPLTTIAQNIEQMSAQAVSKLLQSIDGKEVSSTHLPTSLVIRKSTAKARKGKR